MTPEVERGAGQGGAPSRGDAGRTPHRAADSGEASTAPLRIVVLTPLFPNAAQPNAGLFIRERMFRVAKSVPLVVVVPQPWFPMQSLIRLLRPSYRPTASRHECQSGVNVYFPRFLAVPGLFRGLDGWFTALGCLVLMRRLRQTFHFTLIDAHFAYPSGDAATLLGRWLDVPVTITLRGTENGHLQRRGLRERVIKALSRATRVLAVSDSLRKLAVSQGVSPSVTAVIGNGVDIAKFHPLARDEARRSLGLPQDATVLISIGGLVERKGFHRVLEVMPALAEAFPGLVYLIVGGASPEGDMSEGLRRRAAELGLERRVQFLGHVAPEQLRIPLSAADVFVLATRNEGWANVFLEAMACGLPVVTTDVGGNREVVCDDTLGIVVPFGDRDALARAIADALRRPWDRSAILAHARTHAWESRIAALLHELSKAVAAHASRSA